MEAVHAAGPGGTLSETIHRRLADEITEGRLAPGEEIDETAVAERFGASRTPVREALRELAASGLVVIEPRRRARVAMLSEARLGELFELDAELEALCVRFATFRIAAAQRAALVGVLERMRPAAADGSFDLYDRLNGEFHDLLYASARNTALGEQAQALRRRLAPFRRAQLRTADRLRQSLAEHEAIVAQMMQGDAEAAARLMRAHMLRAGAMLSAYLG